MLQFLILLSAVVCAFGVNLPKGFTPELDHRIVGGVATDIEQVPYQVSLEENGNFICGGCIYDSNTIITAAHCANNHSMQVRAGSSLINSGGVLKNVSSIRKPKNFEWHDIAVLKLESPLTFSSSIKPIGMASNVPAHGEEATVSGWGQTSNNTSVRPTHLRSVVLNIIHQEVCASSMYNYGSFNQEERICAGSSGKDSCFGDSGGPLVSGGVLVGIVSGGMDCDSPIYPGIYMSIPFYRKWLLDNM